MPRCEGLTRALWLGQSEDISGINGNGNENGMMGMDNLNEEDTVVLYLSGHFSVPFE